ncbi:MAG: hypothetical protein Q8P56_06655 [Candidatus Uhrbacteria bacterium]|nr:hypothetical protein [Candidatus Uhrbacteria bacterium]
MKTIVALIVLVAVALPISVNAQTSVSTEVVSKYIAGAGFLPHDGATAQVDVSVTLPKGFFFGLWFSSGFDFKPNFGREVDYTLGWQNEVVGTGLAFYDLNDIFGTQGADIVLPYLELHPSFIRVGQTFVPFARAEYNLCTRDRSKNSSLDLSVGVKQFWQINERFSVNQRIRLLYDDGLFGSRSGFITRWDIGSSVQMTGQIKLNLSVKNSIPSRSMVDRQNLTSFGIGVSSSFPW